MSCPRDSLSAPARAVWAKSASSGGALSLVQHLEDASAVADLLVREWLSPLVLARLSAELPGGEDDVLLLVRWLAGVHDVGKASRGFACADAAGAVGVTAAGLLVIHATDRISRQPRHDVAGYVALIDWLITSGADRRAARSQAMAVGGHHGLFPDRGAEDEARDRLHGHGGADWFPVRTELLDHLAVRTGVQERLQAWQDVRLSPATQMLLTGVVILSDWIASNEALFPRDEDDAVEQRAAAGWRALDLPAAWHPTVSVDPAPAVLRQRTALPRDAAPSPAQVGALEHARAVPPGLAVLEMGMGAGKTEAALVMAADWAARTSANGLLFCLPTRATSSSMFPRVLGFVELQDRGQGSLSAYLAHGKSGLDTTWQGLSRTAPSGLGDPLDPAALEEVATAHAWLSGPKKGMLSSIVVGTIDQLLFSALNGRHVALRHLAVAGKAVVLDEVHAADEFMQVYLHRALEWLGAYGTPVVVLTATLPTQQRRALLEAYERGAGCPVAADVPAAAYPRLTTTGTAGRSAMPLSDSRPTVPVRLEAGGDDDEQVVQRIAALRPGDGIVLVVRNTVARAQQTYRALRRSLPVDEVLLLHSRLLVADRAAREMRLLAALGRDGDRPRRLVVLGTQVVEQSLDIDADLLFTDLAPVDLVLQRLGRLHRHERVRPAGLAQPRCVLVGAQWHTPVPEPARGSALVYGEAGARWIITRTAGLVAVAVTLTSAARSVRARCLRRRPAQPPTVLTDDAVPLHVEVDGQVDADLTVVLVHGYGSRLQEWHHQRRALAPHARIVLFDQRGHGRSGWGHHGRATVDQLGSDLLRVIETHGGPGPVMLVGHSMGGISVLALAAANPALFGSRIAAAALIFTSAGHLMEIGVSRQAARLLRHTHALHPFLWLLWCLAPLLDQTSPFSTDCGRRLLARRLFAESDAPTAALDRTQESFRTTRLSVLAAFAPSLLHHDKAAALPALRPVSVLVLTGAADTTIPPSHSRRIHEQIGRRCQLAVVPGAGHMVNITHPAEVSRRLLQLLQNTAARGGAAC